MFGQILPRETFVDRRLITQEALERRELEMFGFLGQVAPEDEDDEFASPSKLGGGGGLEGSVVAG